MLSFCVYVEEKYLAVSTNTQTFAVNRLIVAMTVIFVHYILKKDLYICNGKLAIYYFHKL